MKTGKRILALIMVFSLFMTGMLANTGVYVDAAAESETTQSAQTDDSGAEDYIATDKSTSSAEDADGSDTVGVIAGEDAYDADLEAVDGEESSSIVEKVDRDSIDVDLTKDSSNDLAIEEESAYDDDDVVKVIIEFEGDSVIEGNAEAEAGSSYANTKISILEKVQESAISEIEDEVLDGEELEITYQYTWLMNGIATEVAYGDISEIEALDCVEKVYIQNQYEALTTDTTSENDILTTSSGGMIGRTETWDLGYTGDGVVIAIIDTGLDVDHQSFAALDLDEEKLEEGYYATESSVAEVIDQLNASERYSGLTSSDVYYNTKVVYGFNYCDDSLDITHDNDSQGDHGTHVAGIAAANETEGTDVVGVAPDAQLYIMKVFGSNGGAYDEDIVAALEDALILGADAVNMSIGSNGGFTSSGDSAMDAVYERIATTNTILAVAAGNSATVGYDNLTGYSSNLTSNPDNGIVSSPGTYANALSVASVENSYVNSYYIQVGDEKFSYTEGENGDNNSITTLYGETYEYVMVDNLGQTLADFTNAGVEGKVAVVSRGTTTFADKTELAEEAGAVACLVYDNSATSESFTADLSDTTATIPMATITLAAGETLAEAYEAGITELTFSDEEELLENPAGYEMNSFSSWGTTADLKIEPDVSAPGGDIYSTLDDGTYGLMSGTSMASPHIAGIAALLQQYAAEEYPDLTDSEVHSFLTALLLSTATPLTYEDGTFYSPRQQGSGLANAEYAVTTTAYLTVEGNIEPQVELGDDPERTGVYEYTFSVVNFGDTNLYYDITTTVQTEDVEVGDDDRSYMSSTPITLDAETDASGSGVIYTYDYDENGSTHSHDAWLAYQSLGGISAEELFRYDLTGDDGATTADVQAYLDALVGNNDTDLDAQVVCVKAGETADINVTVTLTEAGVAWIEDNYVNGIYVEGFTILSTKTEGGVDLSLPYLAFYGDWYDAPIIDGGYYYMTDEELAENANQYYNLIWTNYDGYDDYWVPGDNPYIDDAEDFDKSHMSLSPNNDGYFDSITDIYVSLLRNVEKTVLTLEDPETGEVYRYDDSGSYISKSYYYSGYGICIPYVYSWYTDLSDATWYCTDADGNTLENNSQVTMTIDLYMDADDEDSKDSWTETLIIDTEAPVLDEESAAITINEDGTQTLTLTFSDNVDVAAVNFLTRSGSIIAQLTVDHPENAGDAVTVSYDITGYGNTFYVILGDYAMNESSYLFTTTDNLPVLDTDLLYGFRVYDTEITTDYLYGWVSMNTEEGDDFTSTVLDSEYYIDYAITAAAYVDGYVLAVDADYQLYSIVPGLWDEWTWIADLGVSIRTMTYDPTTGYLYGYSSSDNHLYKIDPMTGAIEAVSTSVLTNVTTIACDDDGVLYAILTSGILRTIDKVEGTFTDAEDADYIYYNLTEQFLEQTGKGDCAFSYSQSMVYDSEDDCLYWAAFSSTSNWRYGGLVRLDISETEEGETDVTLTALGVIQGNAEIVGLLKLEDRGEELFDENATLTAIDTEKDSVSLLVGGSETLNAVLTPWYATETELEWSCEDESVATVDANGKVTAVAVGRTTVTVTNPATGLTASCTINVVNPQSQLTGLVISDNLYYDWATFNASDMNTYEMLSSYSSITVQGAEYYDGYVYGYDILGSFYRFDPEDGYSAEEIGELNVSVSILDMGYDYSTGYMYAVGQSSSGSTYLYYVDIYTGRAEYVASLSDRHSGTAVAMTVDNDGNIYYITSVGYLCKYDPTTKKSTEIGMTGMTIYSYLQSMTFDHDTNEIYWNDIYGLYYVDIETGSALYLGALDGQDEGYSEIIGLHCVPSDEFLASLEELTVEATSMTALEDSVTLLVGMSDTIPVEIKPYNTTERDIEWTISAPEVVEIRDGLLWGLSVGTATVTGTLNGLTVSFEVEVKQSTGSLVAFILYDQQSSGGNFWGSFTDYDLSGGEALSSSDNTYYAGEYYDGYIYATAGYELWKINAETFEEELITTLSCAVFEMAFDYSTGTMYAIGQASSFNSSTNSYLYMIDIETGTCYTVGQSGAKLMTLACAENGIMYGIDADGILYTVDTATAELNEIGSTGYEANQFQSMAIDYDTGNLYWAQCSYDADAEGYVMDFLLVDTEDASVTKLGVLGSYGCEAVSLFSIPEKKMIIGAEAIPTGVIMDVMNGLIQVGETLQLTATLTPLGATSEEAITFESSDNTIATVDNTGLVTGVSKGQVTITATCGDVSGTCVVNVLDGTEKLYSMYSGGFNISAIYTPKQLITTKGYSADEVLAEATMILSTYNEENETFYSIDSSYYLWSYQYDEESGELSNVTVSDMSLREIELFVDINAYPVDLTVNVYDGELYIMMSYVPDSSSYVEYGIFRINPEDPEDLEYVSYVSMDIGTPEGFVFIEENYVMVYDAWGSNFMGQYLSEDESVEANTIYPAMYSFYNNGGTLGLVYSKTLNRVYVAGENYWNKGVIELWEYDVTSGTFSEIGETTYNTGTFDLVLME